jgi:hypothetical protein
MVTGGTYHYESTISLWWEVCFYRRKMYTLLSAFTVFRSILSKRHPPSRMRRDFLAANAFSITYFLGEKANCFYHPWLYIVVLFPAILLCANPARPCAL